jgi:hypothetical protein
MFEAGGTGEHPFIRPPATPAPANVAAFKKLRRLVVMIKFFDVNFNSEI